MSLSTVDKSPAEAEMVDLGLSLPLGLVEQIVAIALPNGRPSEPDRLTFAKRVLAGRRRRDNLFSDVRFGEPSWDMLLDLYVATIDGRKVDVTGLYLASGVAPTTAVRYVDMLIENGLVTKIADEKDGRRSFVTMTPLFRERMEQWLDGELAALRLARLVWLKP